MRVLPALPAAVLAGLSVAAPAPATADSPVVIEGVSEDMRKDIRALLPDRERPATLFEAERIAEEAAARAMAWLRSEGYYAAQVSAEAREEPAEARVVIAPGQRFQFAPPQVTFIDGAPDAASAAAARDATAPIATNAPARAAAVLEAEGAALRALQQAGYPDAAPRDRAVIVDHAEASVSAELRYATGARARLGGVRAEPAGVFRPGFIDDLQNWETGALYTPDALAQLRRDLTGTGAVSRVSTRLDPPGDDGLRDVALEIEPAGRNAYELGLSYSTTEGVGVVGQWTRRNLSGRADPLVVSATLSEMLQDASVELTRPHAAGLGHALRYGAAASREDIEAYQRQGVALYASVDASPRLELGRSYGVRLSHDTYDDPAGAVSEATALSGFGDVRYNTTDNAFDPRDGFILEGRLEPSVSFGDAGLAFLRATAEGRIYESLGAEDRVTLAARLRAGWLEAISGNVDDVPPDRRFFAGGGGSVRGYEYNSIYPQDRLLRQLSPGGQGLVETSVEARWRINERFGAAVFADGGNAFDAWREAGDLRWGAGVGLRYNLGFAPLRIDIAFPLDEAPNDYAFYISLGQAF